MASLIEALKSGRKFRKAGTSGWYLSAEMMPSAKWSSDHVLDEYEIEPEIKEMGKQYVLFINEYNDGLVLNSLCFSIESAQDQSKQYPRGFNRTVKFVEVVEQK